LLSVATRKRGSRASRRANKQDPSHNDVAFAAVSRNLAP